MIAMLQRKEQKNEHEQQVVGGGGGGVGGGGGGGEKEISGERLGRDCWAKIVSYISIDKKQARILHTTSKWLQSASALASAVVTCNTSNAG